MGRFNRVKKGYPCPICGESNWCSFTDKIAICMRVPSDQPAESKSGQYSGYVHRLDGKIHNLPLITNEHRDLPRASDEVCHQVYLELFKQRELALNTDDYRKLAEWGISVEMAKRRGYRRLPLSGRSKIAKSLMDAGLILEGVPGFYVHDDGYWTFSTGPGLIFPSLSPKMKVQGFQVRLDNPPIESKDVTKLSWFDSQDKNVAKVISKGVITGLREGQSDIVISFQNKKITVPLKVMYKRSQHNYPSEVTIKITNEPSVTNEPVFMLRGATLKLNLTIEKVGRKYVWFSSQKRPGGASSGSPWHFAKPKRVLHQCVGITEGKRKADIAAELLGIHVIGLAGVNSTLGVPEFIQSLKMPFISLFDMDLLSNWHVYKAWQSLMQTLKGRGYVGTWDSSFNGYNTKGIDDLLVAGGSPKKIPVDEAMRTFKAPPEPRRIYSKRLIAK